MIIREGFESSINTSVPQVVIIERGSNPSVRAASTNVMGLVGQAIRGDDTIHEIGGMDEFIRKAGDYDSTVGDAYLYAKNFFDAGGGLIKFVRVTSSGTAAASATLSGGIATFASGGVFTVVADSVGTWGNSIKVQVTDSFASGYFNLEVRNGKEVAKYDKVSINSSDARYLSTLVQQDGNAFFTVNMILSSGSYTPVTGTTTMTGGSNGVFTGSTLTDDYYVGTESSGGRTGIQKLMEDNEVIVVQSARETDTINAALVNHVDNMSLSPRRTILTFAQGTSVDTAKTFGQSNDDDKFKVIYPRVGVRNPFTNVKETVSATPFAAAFVTSADYNISMSQVKLPATVIDIERTLTNTEVGTLCKNKINPIVKKLGRGIIFASDYTCSSNPKYAQDTVRRAKDFFAITLDAAMQGYISKPIRDTLYKGLKKVIDEFLLGEWNAGRIGRTDNKKPYSIKVDTQNNPSAIVEQNLVIIEVEISLLGNADRIYVYLAPDINKTIING